MSKTQTPLGSQRIEVVRWTNQWGIEQLAAGSNEIVLSGKRLDVAPCRITISYEPPPEPRYRAVEIQGDEWGVLDEKAPFHHRLIAWFRRSDSYPDPQAAAKEVAARLNEQSRPARPAPRLP